MYNQAYQLNKYDNNIISSFLTFKIYLIIKRCFDIICSLIGCLFLFPIALIIKISYLLTGDYHKIIFTQKRIGKDGIEFKLYKFRSMVVGADEILQNILENDEEKRLEYQKNKKLHNDPRITKIGKFIRKTSIDELPQLINVLKGEMSIIGNRPYLPREKEDIGVFYDDIIKTRPGITGYWQVSGRNELDFYERCLLESYYSINAGFKIDYKIFFKTFKVVLIGKGAK